eukprot:TRINITY_DN6639_c0_g1_i1.p1 TRINITY_DN6639_c0_g1~~TRINITY_DN6639_c0_g1_i1.p1  ORF type:complete len:503 (-),score=61.38 TRINITY_DN6639_c0_g1_i1:147-1577(-)
MDVPPFALSYELRGHDDDVRGLCSLPDGLIATASRDKTIRIWKPSTDAASSGSHYSHALTLVGHKHFVGPLSWLPPNERLPAGALVSGSMDKQVMLWDIASGSPVQTFLGHSEVVTDVAALPNGTIASSSQDKTIRIWRIDGTCEGVLEGHDSAVQAIVSLPDGLLVSGSSDCSIKAWKNGQCILTNKAHGDTVRGLASMPGVGVVSASHDGSVRLWALTGEPLLEMVGHTALVYCVAVANSGEVASGSEDGSAKVWEGGSCLQTLPHPGCVWDVTFLPSGDLLTACSDGCARLWTRDATRAAPPEVVEAYEAQLASRAAARETKSVGGVSVDKLPGPDALQEPGTKDGQYKMIREGDKVVAYSWSATEYQWQMIGDVVDGPQPGVNGKADFEFDVDIGDGVPHRKLKYNHGENPYNVAELWLEEQGLPLGYKEQVVEFIVNNTGGSAKATVSSSTYVDPYTGGGATLNKTDSCYC